MTLPVLALERRFVAPLHRVWQAFTTIDGLCAWMGPAQTQVQCKHLVVVPGGYLHYALVAEGGEPFYGRWDFLSVLPYQLLDYHLAFSDEVGGCVYHPLAPGWPLRTRVQVEFKVEEDDTVLIISACPALDSSEDEVGCFMQSIQQLEENWQEAFAALDEHFAREWVRTGRG